MLCELFVLVAWPFGILVVLLGILVVLVGILVVLLGILDVLPGIVPELCVLVVPIPGMLSIMLGVPGTAITWWTLCHQPYVSGCGAPATSPSTRPASCVHTRYSRPLFNVQNM